MKSIDRHEVQEMSAAAQLVEVLPAEAYRAAHLPGAISMPLKSFGRDATSRLERDRPVIVYCHDFL